MDGETCLQLPRGPVNFRSTAVKPYYRSDDTKTGAPSPQIMDPIDKENLPDDTPRRSPRNANIHGDRPIQEGQPSITGDQTTIREGNAPIPESANVPDPNVHIISGFFTDVTPNMDIVDVFFTEKEARDRQTSIELRAKGIITSPGGPFSFSRRKEIDGLLARGVFELISGHSREIGDARIFGSRLVDEVKGKGTATPYEKSRLVIQAFNDEGKKTVLTQSPTIQPVSQRIIVAISPSSSSAGSLCT